MLQPLAFTFSLLIAGSIAAQQPLTEPSSAVLQRCLLHTTSETWARLNLSPDQLQRMKYIHEACVEECKAAGAQGNQNPISNANGETVLTDVRNVLSAEQYKGWVAQCKEEDAPTK